MAAQLTTLELLTNEIGLMTEKRKSLEAAIKASEARLKDVRAEFDKAEVQARQDLEKLQIEQEQKKAALQDCVGPLKGQVEALRNQVASEQAKVEAVKAESLAVLDERMKKLAGLDAAIKSKQHTLELVADDINALKTKVSAL